MKINARFIEEGVKNDMQGKAHYRLLIQRIISGGIFVQLSCLNKYLRLYLCGSLFDYLTTNLDEGYRILHLNQNPQNPAFNPSSANLQEKQGLY